MIYQFLIRIPDKMQGHVMHVMHVTQVEHWLVGHWLVGTCQDDLRRRTGHLEGAFWRTSLSVGGTLKISAFLIEPVIILLLKNFGIDRLFQRSNMMYTI